MYFSLEVKLQAFRWCVFLQSNSEQKKFLLDHFSRRNDAIDYAKEFKIFITRNAGSIVYSSLIEVPNGN